MAWLLVLKVDLLFGLALGFGPVTACNRAYNLTEQSLHEAWYRRPASRSFVPGSVKNIPTQGPKSTRNPHKDISLVVLHIHIPRQIIVIKNPEFKTIPVYPQQYLELRVTSSELATTYPERERDIYIYMYI